MGGGPRTQRRARIVLRLRTYGPPRLEVHGRYPHYRDGRSYGGRWLEITCSAARSPAVLAKDIERRLLVPYLAAYAEAREAIAQREREEEAAHAVALRLAEALGEEPSAMRAGQMRVRVGETSAAYGHFEISAGEEPHIAVRLSGLSARQAEKIVEALLSEAPNLPAEIGS